MISEDKIQEILRATDIVEIVSEVVALKQAGNSFKGLCPFHEEKTPSFTVSAPKQVYYCFGCQKGGNVFRFVMDHEKLTFPEAVRMLASRYGIEVPADAPGGPLDRDREELYRVLKWATDVYHKQLLATPESQPVRDYVASRGISEDSVATFRLGHAPEEWDFLLQRARKQNIPDPLLLEAGLISPRKEKDGAFDRFRGRLMFPIFDVRDRVVGFGGRILPQSTQKETAKYINTSETPLFNKGRLLYGLNFAREASSKEGALSIMEGYTDVILAHQHGFRIAVAGLGTALTKDHVALFRRFADRVYAVYDGDQAGEKASARSLDLMLEEDIDFRVATMPGGLDPADCLQQRGPEAFRAAIEAAVPLLQYRIELAIKSHDWTSVEGKSRAIDEVLGSVALCPNEVKRKLQVQKLAADLDIPQPTLLKRLAALQAAAHRPRPTSAPSTSRPAPAPTGTTTTPPAGSRGERELVVELLDLLLSAPALLPSIREAVTLEEIPNEPARRVVERIYAHWDRAGELRAADFLQTIEDPAVASRLAGIIAEGEKKGNHEERLSQLLHKFELERREREATGLRRQASDDDGLRAFQEARRRLDQTKRGDQGKRGAPGTSS